MNCYDEYDTDILFTDIDKDLEIFDDFCDLAEYRLCQYKYKDELFYNIYDLQLNEYRERNNMTWEEVVMNWLERVSTYYYDEWDWEDILDEEFKDNNGLNINGIQYVLNIFNNLYKIAVKYNVEDEYTYLLDHIKDLEKELQSISLCDKRDYEIKIIVSSENNVYLKKDDELILIDDITNLDYSFVEVVRDIIKNNYIK